MKYFKKLLRRLNQTEFIAKIYVLKGIEFEFSKMDQVQTWDEVQKMGPG